MTEKKQKVENSTSVRIYLKTKERLKRVARKLADREDRVVTELEIADDLISHGLKNKERKLGIK